MSEPSAKEIKRSDFLFLLLYFLFYFHYLLATAQLFISQIAYYSFLFLSFNTRNFSLKTGIMISKKHYPFYLVSFFWYHLFTSMKRTHPPSSCFAVMFMLKLSSPSNDASAVHKLKQISFLQSTALFWWSIVLVVSPLKSI